MDIVLVLLRLLHIVAAFVWFGLGATMTLYVVPAAEAAGDSGWHYLKSLLSRTTFSTAIASASGLTTLAGILLYIVGDVSKFSSIGNAVLGIGAAAGLLATLHGGMATGRATTALKDGLQQHVTEGNQPVSQNAVQTLRELVMKLGTHSRISFALMVVALIGMASARYL